MQMISQYIYRLLRKMVVILSWHACLCRGGEQVEDVRDITWQQDLKNIQNWDSPIELSFTHTPPPPKIQNPSSRCILRRNTHRRSKSTFRIRSMGKNTAHVRRGWDFLELGEQLSNWDIEMFLFIFQDEKVEESIFYIKPMWSWDWFKAGSFFLFFASSSSFFRSDTLRNINWQK